MKKALAFLLPLAMLISSVSCSKNSDNSDPATESVTASDASVDLNSASAEGTNYTKGAVKDGLYVNDYAGIKVKIPENLHLASDTELKALVDSSVSYYTDEKNKAFEAGTVWDGWITNDGNIDNIFVRFINTKVAFPGASDVSADDVLDIFKARNDGSEAKYLDRTNVTLAGTEYRREICSFEGSAYNLPFFYYYYARKIDDDMICLISISTNKTDSTSDYFESLFE